MTERVARITEYGRGQRAVHVTDEPVIRCRDCRFVHVEDGAVKRHWCDRMDRRKQHYMLAHPDGFCSWGEPRG